MDNPILGPLVAVSATDQSAQTIGAITIAENTSVALASVGLRASHQSETRTKLETFLGAPLAQAGHASGDAGLHAMWIAPDMWMFGADNAARFGLAVELKTVAVEGASITDQSGAWVCFDLEGEGVLRVMERLCNIDFGKMKSNDATRSLIEHLGCFVLCRNPATSYRVIGPRSSAKSLLHALISAAHAVA